MRSLSLFPHLIPDAVRPPSSRFAVLGMTSLLLHLVACGGGGGTSASTPPQTPPPAPHWEAPVDLGGTAYQGGLSLSGDGKGGVVAAWLRQTTDAGGAVTQDVVATRMASTGLWADLRSIESSTAVGYVANDLQAPVAAVDSRGKGWIAYFKAAARSTTVNLRMLPVDLTAATAFGSLATELSFADLQSLDSLQVAVGTDGSALAAWRYLRSVDGQPNLRLGTIQASRRSPAGTWSAPANFHLNMFSFQGVNSLVGYGAGRYLLEYFTGDEYAATEAAHYVAGSEISSNVAGWDPDIQMNAAAHQTVWATNGSGGAEAWLRYDLTFNGEALWPRQGTADGVWTMGAAVTPPLPATSYAVSREPDGTGWFAGSGTSGLWVAPLTGTTMGTHRVLLPMPSEAAALTASRDALGRPALFWVQTRNGTHEGLGFSRWNGTAWSAPELLPGITSGATIQGFRAVAALDGLVVVWAETSADPGTRLRSARWH
jgi:hypothetical protein